MLDSPLPEVFGPPEPLAELVLLHLVGRGRRDVVDQLHVCRGHELRDLGVAVCPQLGPREVGALDRMYHDGDLVHSAHGRRHGERRGPLDRLVGVDEGPPVRS
jgi:hypothetical protein